MIITHAKIEKCRRFYHTVNERIPDLEICLDQKSALGSVEGISLLDALSKRLRMISSTTGL